MFSVIQCIFWSKKNEFEHWVKMMVSLLFILMISKNRVIIQF